MPNTFMYACIYDQITQYFRINNDWEMVCVMSMFDVIMFVCIRCFPLIFGDFQIKSIFPSECSQNI